MPAARRTIVAMLMLILWSASIVAAEDLQEFDGFKGVWVRSSAIECFAGLQPKFRILAVRRPGESTLLAGSKASEAGVRLAFMGPDQVPPSFDVGDQPAQIIERNEKLTRVRLKPADNLRYTVTLTPHPAHARLMLDLELENIDSAPRRLACWSVLSFPRDGMIVVPFGPGNRDRKKLVIPWWTRLPQDNVIYGRTALAVDTPEPVNNAVCKFGIATTSGWIAYALRERAVVSFATFEPAATYPEDGANVSFFVADAPQSNRAEIEHMGALETVAPGNSIHFKQTLELLTIPPEAPDPDSRRQQIEQQLKASASPTSMPAR